MLIDIIAGILLVYGFYSGYKRGLIETLFDILSIIIAILAALKLSPIVISLVDRTFKLNEGVSFILGFVLTFFIVMLLIRFIGGQLEKLLKAVHINFVNKFIGGALMSFVLVLFFSGVLWLSNKMTLLPEELKSASVLYPVLESLPTLAEGLFVMLKPLFLDFWELTTDTIDKIKEGNQSNQ